MAQKRMFSLKVIDTDKFLEMPISSRLLYYELSMRADDDGFVDNWKKILSFTGLKEDDMKVLIAKRYIIPFESGVIVIRHWRLNNYLQNDRITPTIYQDELSMLYLDDGVYALTPNDFNESTFVNEDDNAKAMRKIAYQESDLPYSFDYKIRKAFIDKPCPICGNKMKYYVNAPHRPTIQHNIPISKGGKHELGNISVICHKCNISIKDKETCELNAQEVADVWDKISCIQGRIHSIDKNNICSCSSYNKNNNILEDNRDNRVIGEEEKEETLYDYTEKNFNRILSPIEIQKIDEWLKDFNEDMIKYAINLSVLGNKKTFKYVDGILKNWKGCGYKSLEEVKENENVKKEPIKEELFDYDWLNDTDMS